MGRFVGLSKNKTAGGKAIEDASYANAGKILTSDGEKYIAAAGAVVNPTSVPQYINASDAISTTLSLEGALSTSTFTWAWRSGAQYGLTLASNGALSGTLSSPPAGNPATVVLNTVVTDTKYGFVYNEDVSIIISSTNDFPTITTDNTSVNIAYATTPKTVQFANSGTATEWAITTRGTLPIDVTISSTGLMTFPTTPTGSGTDGGVTYTFTLGVRNTNMPAATYRTKAFTKQISFLLPPQGQQQYQGVYGVAGGQSCTFTWVAPAGVTSVNVMAIAGGGGGCYQWAVCGGHGGGMVWANNIPVTPGSSYTVLAGSGGCWNGTVGGCSCWPGMVACGGCCGCYGGCFSFPSSVNGGAGSCCGGYGMVAYPSTAGGGGGAAGYCSAAPASSATPGYVGCGGGGGSATGYHSSTYGTGGGGGTGSCGMCCYTTAPTSCGCCGNAGYSHTTGSGGNGGSGGTCGLPGEPWSNGQGNGYGCGGTFGGGGGGGGTSHGGGWGGPGVVRIIWGQPRCWPCCNTHTLPVIT
jgi:hypothetical protein